MPYTIHIPAPYQMRNRILFTLHSTTAPSIDIGIASPLSTSIYNDAKAWGWNVDYTPISIYTREAWATYRALARRNGWFNDLWYIWQREHGLRIKVRDAALYPVSPGPVRVAVRGWTSWVKRPGRLGGLSLVERTIESVRKVRAATYGRREVGLRRTASEGDLWRVDAEVQSLTGSLVERLGAFRVDREGGVAMMEDEEETVKDEEVETQRPESDRSESLSPFSDKHALTKEWYE